jgi:hypothetical protein
MGSSSTTGSGTADTRDPLHYHAVVPVAEGLRYMQLADAAAITHAGLQLKHHRASTCQAHQQHR